jgi:hypothetical protein
MKFDHSTSEQLRQAVRERFRTAKGIEAIRLSRYLVNQKLPDEQLRTLFSVPMSELARVKGKLNQLTNLYDAVRSAAGE